MGIPFEKREGRGRRRIVALRRGPKDFRLPENGRLILSSDSFVEGVHFDLTYTTPRELGHKCLAVVLSDLAAVAARPLWAQLAVGMRQETGEPFLLEWRTGVDALARQFRLGIGVGHPFPSPTALIVNVLVAGALDRHHVAFPGARPGDRVAVTGTLGAGGAGMNCLRRLGKHALTDEPDIFGPYLTPQPRVREALALAKTGAITSMTDLSEGLAAEIRDLAHQNGLGALIDESKIPIAESTRRAERLITSNARAWSLYGAEDFQLLFTFAPGAEKKISRAVGRNAPVTVIGEMAREANGVQLMDIEGQQVPLAPRIWHHFVRRRKAAR